MVHEATDRTIDSMTLNAYLLTRHWRDTPRGIELSLWACSDQGPVKLLIEGQQAVCFVERTQVVDLPVNCQRKPLELSLLHGSAVDGLYFNQQRDLQQLRQGDITLCESDIKPVDRYLMERFIRAPVVVEGELQKRDGYLQVSQPQVKPGEYQPTLRTVAIDIETRGHSRDLYSIAAATLLDSSPASNVVFIIGQGENETCNGYQLIYQANESELLNSFFDWIGQVDPDIISGWAVINFDLNFIDQKCRALGIKFRLGRGGETAAVLQPGNPGSPRIARVPGRAVFDGIDLLKAGFWAFDSFSLDNVSHVLLGTGKLITSDQDKVAQINHLFQHDKPALADYNYRDCTLVNDIFVKADLLAFAIQRANLTGLALDRLGGSVAAFDNLYLPRLHRQGFVAPDIHNRSDAAGSPGGYVMDSAPGLYHNVLVLDFKSLYPSIIRTFFIDPLGLAEPGENPLAGFVDARFSRDTHILPGMIEELWAARDEAKETRNAPLSQAIKIIMNSFYGVLGTTGCRFYSQQLASSITRRGHEIITQSRDWIVDQGYDVIYGDTDSVFVLIGPDVKTTQCTVIGQQLMQGLNQWWTEQLQSRFQIESHLEVEFETHYTRFFMPTVRGMPTGSKKRYAGLVLESTTTSDDESSSETVADTGTSRLVVKGLEAARNDWTPLARNFQRELFHRVFHELPFEQFVRTTAEQLQLGDLDEELVYSKRIRRALNDYQRNVPPHIQAARKLERSGNSIRYVITRNGPEPVEALHSTPDYQHYIDKQLAPAADGILQFLDTSFAAITDAQMQMF